MIDVLNSLGRIWWAWMWPMCGQVALLAALVWIMDLFLRRRAWPQVRYALWLLVLVKLIIPPTFSLPTSVSARAIDVGRPKLAAVAPGMLTPAHVEPVPSEPDFSAVATEQTPPASPAAPIELDTTELPAPKRRALSLQAWLMLVSSAASLLLFLVLMLRTRRLRRRVLSETNPEDVSPWMNEVLHECARNLRLKRLPRLVVTEHVGSAAVLGVFRPVLLLPREVSANASREEMSHILLHELAHVKRGDLIVNALQTLLHIVYWFHPLVWLGGRRLRHLRELCCDATVSTVLKERTSEYRRTIMKASEKLVIGETGVSLGLLGLFENASRLRQRLEHLTRPTWKHPRLRMLASLTTAALMLACILPMAGGKGRTDETPIPERGATWGEAMEGLRCRWVTASGPVAAGTTPVLTMEVKNVSASGIFWYCGSEISWGLSWPNSSLREGTMHPRFNVQMGPGVRPATAREARKEFNIGISKGRKDSDPIPRYYHLSPGSRLTLTAKWPWRLESPGRVRIEAALARYSSVNFARVTGTDRDAPFDKPWLTCPPLVLVVAEAKPGAKQEEPAWGEVSNGLQCRLLPETQTVEVTEEEKPQDIELYIRYELRNVGDRVVRFLPWDTPLKQRMSESYLKVIDPDGQPARYRGRRAERMPPRKDNYLSIAPGQTLTNCIRLTYDFTKLGEYQVSITTTRKPVPDPEILFYYGGVAEEAKKNPDNLWTGTLKSNTINVNIVRPGQELPGGVAKKPTEAEWGETVEGVQCRLRADKLVWEAGEVPTLKADVRNQGMHRVFVLPFGKQHGYIQFNGQWCWRGDAKVMWATIILGPGEEHHDYTLIVPQALLTEGRERLSLTPGKHTIRVAFEARRRGQREGFRIISNPVEIEVLPPWGKAVEGVQCRLRADKLVWEAGEIPVVELDVRNRGKRDLKFLQGPEYIEFEMDGLRYYHPITLGGIDIHPLPPGAQVSGIRLPLYRQLRKTDPPPQIEQGKHQVRVTIDIHPAEGDGGNWIKVTSNPVEVEILSLLEAFKAERVLWKQANIGRELIALGDKSAIPEVAKMLKSQECSVRCNAGWVLVGLGDERGLVAVLAELKDTSPRPTKRIRSDGTPDVAGQIRQDRYYAAHVLGETGDRRAVPALIEVLKDESINYQAAIILGKLGDRRAVRPLKQMLKIPDPSQRLWAAYGLARLGDPVGVATLVEFVKDPQWTRRRHAVDALGELQDKRAVPALIEALKDENVNVRVSAAKALGKLGDPRAIDSLEALSQDNAVTTSGRPTAVRDAAAQAIRQIRSVTEKVVDPPWGKAVEGVQCRLRAEKAVWEAGEVPSFRADVRNLGKRDLLVFRSQLGCQVEFNGKWFEQKEIGAPMSFFPPGQRYDDISIPLEGPWVTPRDDERLRLEPGKHTVRVAFICEPTRLTPGKPVRAISNPVEIEIVPAER